MKIGIITYHRAHNYGAVLQCYALQEIIRAQGHEVEIIDYRQPFIENLYNLSKIHWLKKNLFHPRKLLNFKKIFDQNYSRNKIFEEFRNQYLNTSKPFSGESIPEYDLYVVGSDQMWSLNCVGNMIDNVYFGNFKRKIGSKLIGFSVSSNVDSLHMIESDLSYFATRFNDISFREDLIAELVNKKLNCNYITTLDPTLCADKSIWDHMLNNVWATKRDYIVVYHVKLRFASIVHNLILRQANRLAELNNWDVIDLSSGNYTVVDFVSAIKYAKCVVTSSFHATVFSVIFNRPLFSIKLHDGGDCRYTNLLESLGMTESSVDLDFDKNTPQTYDDTVISNRLESLRTQSLKFLFKYIE